MNWLITGGSGQLGSALSRELEANGYEYLAYNSSELDITKKSSVWDKVIDFSPSIIVNCAAWTDVDGAEANEVQATEVNCDGVGNISKAAKFVGAKLIHISTDYVFSGENSLPWLEKELPNPRSAYGRSKAQGERLVSEIYPENSSIVRTAWLYSPWRKNFAKTMTRLALYEKGDLRVVNDQIGQPTYAVDLAKQVVALAISNSPAGIYHGTNSGEATWFDFAREIFELVGADSSRIIPATSYDYRRPAKRPANSILSHAAWKETKVSPLRNWRTALIEAMPEVKSAVEVEELSK
jgi:dTDP-4-dehydrorhamnose reductase